MNSSPNMDEAIRNICHIFLQHCPDKRERLKVLAHLVAMDLSSEEMTPEEMISYLNQIVEINK